MSVDVGATAPDFTLMNQDAEPITLSEQRGYPVVLAFIFGAFSSTCINELCTLRDRLSELNKVQARVFGISVDTFFVLKAFQKDQQLTFPLLSDFNKDVIRAYDVIHDEVIGLRGIAKRAAGRWVSPESAPCIRISRRRVDEWRGRRRRRIPICGRWISGLMRP